MNTTETQTMKMIWQKKAANKGEAEIIIAKHRNGPVGTIKLLFQSNITKFKNPMKSDTF